MSVKPSAPAAKLYSPRLPANGQRLGALGSLAGQPATATAAAAPRYRTVGDYYSAQADAERQQVGRVFEGIAELAPPVLLGQIAAIQLHHDMQADQRILDLPWDPNGQWKAQAADIRAQESQAADNQVSGLPLISAARSAGQIISDGTSTVATAAYDGAVSVGTAAVQAVDTAGQAVADAGKSVARGLLGVLAYTGEGMVDFANSHKKEFQ